MSEPNLTPFREATDRLKPGLNCGVAKARATMTPKHKADFEAAMASPDISARAIVEVLQQWGHFVSGQVVNRHRVGACRCKREAK